MIVKNVALVSMHPAYSDGTQESNWRSILANTIYHLSDQFSNQTSIRMYPLHCIALDLNRITYILFYYFIKYWD